MAKVAGNLDHVKAFAQKEREAREAAINKVSATRQGEQSFHDSSQKDGEKTVDSFNSAMTQAEREMNPESAAFNAEWRIAMLKINQMLFQASVALSELPEIQKIDPLGRAAKGISELWQNIKNAHGDESPFPKDKINMTMNNGKLKIDISPVMKDGKPEPVPPELQAEMDKTGGIWLRKQCKCTKDPQGKWRVTDDNGADRLVETRDIQTWQKEGRDLGQGLKGKNFSDFIDEKMSGKEASPQFEPSYPRMSS
jgi:hypothetical protein